MKAFERDDPLTLISQVFPVESEVEADRDMARCFVEEYALMGFTAVEIGHLFEAPVYAAPHAILRRRGDAFIRDIIHGVFGGRP